MIGYLAAMPDHRGQGYITDILNEGVSVLAATGVHQIRAATDMTNTPMANAFLGNGWCKFARSIDMAWPAKCLAPQLYPSLHRACRARIEADPQNPPNPER
ncbi:MAG: GNAT family N-acetyltransferase [Ornithinimicrobium sp.]